MTRTQDRSHSPVARRAWIGGASALAIAVATLIVPAGMTNQAEAARLQPRTVYPTATLAVIKTIPVGGSPSAVALNDADDTVYVTNDGTNNVSVINGRTGQLTDDTITVGTNPNGVAVHQADDTVYVANQGPGTMSVINGRTNTFARTIPVGTQPLGVAIDQTDDTVYVVNYSNNNVRRINARNLDDSSTVTVGSLPYMVAVNQVDDTVYVTNGGANTVSVIKGISVVATIGAGSNPNGVAVNQADDTVYVVNSSSNNVSVINGRTGQRTDDTVTVGNSPAGVAVDQADDTVYVTNASSNNVSVINGRTAQRTDDTITVGNSPSAVAVDQSLTNAGLVYVTNLASNSVSVIGRVTPSLQSSSGEAGDTSTITLTVPNLAAGFAMDDSTIASISFDDTPATGLAAGAGNTWTVTVPAGSGTVPVNVTFKGGLRASAGNFTYGSPAPPTPTPPTPAGAPSDIKATSGDNSAVVTWVAPASSGSYPITDYQAIASPGGRTCLVPAPALSCEITGLTNGAAYTFTVQALTGAGWGPASSASNAVTPEPSTSPTIVITGYRGSGANTGRVYANGTTTSLAGETVRARVKVTGEPDYRDGSTRTVSGDETFTWQRKTGKKTYVYFTHDQTRSNSITIPAR